jgi:murein DD-endopeptidase MepM/ murein hydrolase activator NlpD
MNAPIKNFKLAYHPEGSITQFFGENPDLYARFGFVGHTGVDVVAPHGEPIMAVEGGIVVDVKYDPKGFGKHVRILSPTGEQGKHREWAYGHLSAIHVTVGERVKAGEVIGLMGNTGFVVSGATPFWEVNPYAGTHLHLQCRIAREDNTGWSYPGSNLKIQIENYNNGYKGCFDIAPFFKSNAPRIQKMLTIISLLKTVISLLKKKRDVS